MNEKTLKLALKEIKKLRRERNRLTSTADRWAMWRYMEEQQRIINKCKKSLGINEKLNGEM